MSGKEFYMLTIVISLALYMIGIPFYKKSIDSRYEDKKSGNIFMVFCWLVIMTLVGGLIIGLIKYQTGG